MSITQEQIQDIVFRALKLLGEELESSELMHPTLDTQIYGNAAVDSLALVSFVADLEEILSSEIGVGIVLADEKMMSAKNTPFKTTKTLIEYITTLLSEHA